MRSRGRRRLVWLARRVAKVHSYASCAAVVLSDDGEFLSGLAATEGAGLIELAEHLVDDPRWLGRGMRVVYVETRAELRPSLVDLARWHDLVSRHAEGDIAVADLMLVDSRSGRVQSMALCFGGVAELRV